MKKYYFLIPVIILLAFSSCKETSELSDKNEDVIGAYQYTGNKNGMAILSEKHFIFVPYMDTVSTMVDSLNTGENIPKQILVEAGTWSMQDSIITLTFLYHSNPAKIGTTTRVTRTINGNNVDNYILGKNGEILDEVPIIRLD